MASSEEIIQELGRLQKSPPGYVARRIAGNLGTQIRCGLITELKDFQGLCEEWECSGRQMVKALNILANGRLGLVETTRDGDYRIAERKM